MTGMTRSAVRRSYAAFFREGKTMFFYVVIYLNIFNVSSLFNHFFEIVKRTFFKSNIQLRMSGV